MVVAGDAFCLKAALSRVEDHRVLEVLVPGLVEGLRSLLRSRSNALLVLARPGNVELEALTVVSLVEVEPGRCAVKAHFLAYLRLEISSARLTNPVALPTG